MSVPIVFVGTPDFAIPSLRCLCEAEAIEVRGVISRPDKPRGRKRLLEPTPVKVEALERGLEVFQPRGLKQSGVMDWLRDREPAALVVVAYGGMVPPDVLEMPRYGCLNLHPSLLPKYRGAAPIQWSLINGDAVTGVCTMYLSEGWDDGDVIYRREVPIEPRDDAGTLSERLSRMGAELMCQTVRDVAEGTAPREPQDESLVTWAPKIEPVHERLDWSKSAEALHASIRGLSPAPGAHTTFSGKRVKIFRSEIVPVSEGVAPGEVYDVSMGTVRVATGQGGLELLEMQPDGKRRMRAVDFLNGHRIQPGTLLGDSA